MSLLRSIKSAQRVYRQRLHAYRKQVWEEYLSQCRRWQSICAARDQRFWSAVENSPPTRALLHQLIRRLAVINRATGYASIHHEFTDALKGKDGPRGCGPGCWDDAVKVWEEDR